MKSLFSKFWKSSKKPSKQRKYIANAPLHIKKTFLAVHLSKDLKTKYGKRSFQVRSGDKVKILRGDKKGKEGKVEKVSVKKGFVHIAGITYMKKDGVKAFYPVKPSNLMIVDLNLSDKKRKAKLEGKTESKVKAVKK